MVELRQAYDRPSAAALTAAGIDVALATEASRPGVRLDATIGDGLGYARAMVALHAVATTDLRRDRRDHADYQRWVQERYLEELDAAQREALSEAPAALARRAELAAAGEALAGRILALERATTPVEDASFAKARQRYFRWLHKHDREAWIVVDPVVSVHDDVVMFEAFSLDESVYGRVTLPMAGLTLHDDPSPGVTNVDFSDDLAREIARIRTYRPARLRVGAEAVNLGTEAGRAVEKKIDLPASWPRAFLQTQAAEALPALDLRLQATTLADILTLLARRRERHGPRSLRFRLDPGEAVRVVVEPWGDEVVDRGPAYDGRQAHDVRVWGRQRLQAFEPLLPEAAVVRARLLGSGMPSFWSVDSGECRFQIGLSGWTGVDWATRARFDLLAATGDCTPRDVVRTMAVLAERRSLTALDASESTGMPRATATAALQRLCRDGRAMYDAAIDRYRWRPLLPAALDLERDESDERLA
jgi:hypothetical protein